MSQANRPSSTAALAAAPTPIDTSMATPEQLVVLKRIDAQRGRLHARALALRQAAAIDAEGPDRVNADAPLPMRLMTFARLHPVAIAAVVGLALVAGPRRIMRVAGVVLPIVMRMRR